MTESHVNRVVLAVAGKQNPQFRMVSRDRINDIPRGFMVVDCDHVPLAFREMTRIDDTLFFDNVGYKILAGWQYIIRSKYSDEKPALVKKTKKVKSDIEKLRDMIKHDPQLLGKIMEMLK